MSIISASHEKVNLGCGPNAPPGWLNVDGSWNAWLWNHKFLRNTLQAFGLLGSNLGAQWRVTALVHDITKPLPFADESVSVIYGSHVLEHLYLVDARLLLRECKRVLKPGGVLRLVVPDLHAIVQAYLENKNQSGLDPSKSIAADNLNEALNFRSPAPPSGNILFRVYSLWKDFHHHKWMYDSDSLIREVKAAGFAEVSERTYLDSSIHGIVEVEEASRVLDGAGVCVEARKTLQPFRGEIFSSADRSQQHAFAP